MKNRGWAGMALVLTLSLGTASAQTTTPAPGPVESPGLLEVDVKFAADGTVAACRIVHSNVPYTLEAGTVDYIRRKWVNEWFAGEAVRFPITFAELPWYAKKWSDGLVTPPNFLTAGDPGRKLKLRVTFGPDGWAQRVEVKESSGLADVDRNTAVWVKVHWHNVAYQGQTVDAPFVFKTPLLPKPPVAKAPPKPQPTAAPEEPQAAPAVRVQ